MLTSDRSDLPYPGFSVLVLGLAIIIIVAQFRGDATTVGVAAAVGVVATSMAAYAASREWRGGRKPFQHYAPTPA